MVLVIRPSIHGSRAFESLGEPLACLRVCILTKSYEVALGDDAVEAEHFRAFANPLSHHTLCLGVVIAGRKMLLKIRLRVFEVGLGLRREHAPMS
jgi:hypothetical protein